MTHRKKIKIPLYPSYLVLLYTDDFEDLKKDYPEAKKTAFSDYWAASIEVSNKFIIFFNARVLKCIRMEDAFHETTHVVNRIFAFIEQAPNRYNDEPEAHLAGWIGKQIMNFARHNKIEIR